MKKSQISDLAGKTLVRAEAAEGLDEAVFVTDEGEEFLMWHDQNCCEWVAINDVCGDIGDLIGSPILLAEEVSSSDVFVSAALEQPARQARRALGGQPRDRHPDLHGRAPEHRRGAIP